jgi:hypothetical protein
MTATLNGKPQRKQLSDQLDRLDGIIDALADALPDAVRDAVKEGTEAALKQVLLDLLTDPTIMNRIQQAATVSPPPVPSRTGSFLTRCRDKATALASRVMATARDTANQVRSGVVESGKHVRRTITTATVKTRSFLAMLDFAWQLKKAVVIGLGIAVAVATLASVSHSAAAILAGAGAGTTAIAVQVGLWARRSLRTLAG